MLKIFSSAKKVTFSRSVIQLSSLKKRREIYSPNKHRSLSNFIARHSKHFRSMNRNRAKCFLLAFEINAICLLFSFELSSINI